MIAARPREIAIDTPEGVRFNLALAGPGARFAAGLIDFAIVIAATSSLAKVLGVFQGINADLVRAITTAGYFVISIGYAIAAEWIWRGQTVGKRVMKLRVVDSQGLQLEFQQILIRNLLRVVDILPALYLVGGAAVLLTRDAQRLGDMAANTVVIRQREGTAVDIARITVGRYNSLLENRMLAARLRQKAKPDLISAAYEALVRRDEMEPEARIEVFRRAAEQLRGLSPFPEELTEGMTDEQFVRAALAAIYHTGVSA